MPPPPCSEFPRSAPPSVPHGSCPGSKRISTISRVPSGSSNPFGVRIRKDRPRLATVPPSPELIIPCVAAVHQLEEGDFRIVRFLRASRNQHLRQLGRTGCRSPPHRIAERAGRQTRMMAEMAEIGIDAVQNPAAIGGPATIERLLAHRHCFRHDHLLVLGRDTCSPGSGRSARHPSWRSRGQISGGNCRRRR